MYVKKNNRKTVWGCMVLIVVFLGVGGSLAQFSSLGSILNNAVSAALLNIEVKGGEWEPKQGASEMKPGDNVSASIKVVNNSGIELQQQMRVLEFSGDLEFCRALRAQIHLDGVLQHEGRFEEIITGSDRLGTSTPAVWRLTLEFPGSISGLYAKTCSFDVMIEAGQNEYPIGQGFVFQNSVNYKITSDGGDSTDPDCQKPGKAWGYWRNYYDAFKTHRPEFVGNREMASIEKSDDALEIFGASVKGQLEREVLLAKLNSSYFGIGEESIGEGDKSTKQIIEEADLALQRENFSDPDRFEELQNKLKRINGGEWPGKCPDNAHDDRHENNDMQENVIDRQDEQNSDGDPQREVIVLIENSTSTEDAEIQGGAIVLPQEDSEAAPDVVKNEEKLDIGTTEVVEQKDGEMVEKEISVATE